MKRRLLLSSLLSASLLQSAAFADATSEAEQRLRGAINDVLAVAKSASSGSALAERARPVLQKHVSFETMTRRAVGVGWRQFSPDQQKKAVQLFTTLMIRTYSVKFTPGEQPEIQFRKATAPAEGRVDVPTTLVYAGSRYNVTYRMEQANGWRIVDVVIEGVSLVANYRSQLDATFKKGGAAAVISSLEQSASRPK